MLSFTKTETYTKLYLFQYWKSNSWFTGNCVHTLMFRLQQKVFSHLYGPTCLFIQRKQSGHVARKEVVGNLAKPARISVSGNNADDLCARLSVAADAHGVLLRAEHWSVVVQVLDLNVHIGLSTQASLRERILLGPRN